ncbi:MAG: conjugative transposon protein TraJ [Ferruginibacter sp.]
MKKYLKAAIVGIAVVVSPVGTWAQSGGLAGDIKGLQGVLDQLYEQMIPMCSQLIGVGRGIAGFAAMWYIAARVWRHLSHAEAIDFYPLFRPFVIGFAIIMFPSVIGLINGVMKPTVNGTAAMVTNTDAAIAALLKEKENTIKQTDVYKMYMGETGNGDRDKWYKYTHPGDDPDDEGLLAGIGNDIKFAMAKASYNFRNSIKEWMSEVLQVLFAAASLCINTIRTFNLIILAILGPLAFGLSVFDGFHQTLRHWLARYINVFLWLPVANIFGAVIGKIQENMLKIDLSQISQSGDTFFSRTDMGYLIFMIIGIIGYFTVPSIASHIMWVGGGDALTSKASGMAVSAAGGAFAGGMAGASSGVDLIGHGAQNLGNATGHIIAGYNSGAGGSNSTGGGGRGDGNASNYIKEKLSGNQKST